MTSFFGRPQCRSGRHVWMNWNYWMREVYFLGDDAHTVITARAIRDLARTRRRRSFWAHEIECAWGSTQTETIAALHRLSGAGLLSRCPGTCLYIPTIPDRPRVAGRLETAAGRELRC